MFERYWNFTTCIRSDNLAAIADVMTHLLEQEEGCRRLTQLPEITIDSEQLRSLPACGTTALMDHQLVQRFRRIDNCNRHSALQDVIHRYSRIFPNNAQLLSINTDNYWGFVIAI